MDAMSQLEAFELMKEQIGYCSIWCGSCIISNGTLREMSSRYRQMLADHGLAEWGPRSFNLKEFDKGLVAMEGVPLCAGCRQGGGREECEIRACATEKGVEYCGQCASTTECPQAQLLEHMRSGAALAGLFVETAAADPRALVERWLVEIKGRWPSCILFAHCE